MQNPRLAGHGLVREGAPYDADGLPIRRGTWGDSRGGSGRAKCSCGALSDDLSSGSARRKWHHEHKESLAESNLVKHARRELELVGEEPEMIAWYLRVVKAFVSYGHSGGSASVAIPVLNRLLQYQELSLLTDSPAEWVEVGEGMWQNVRRSTAFSRDGGKTYTDLNQDGAYYSVVA